MMFCLLRYMLSTKILHRRSVGLRISFDCVAFKKGPIFAHHRANSPTFAVYLSALTAGTIE